MPEPDSTAALDGVELFNALLEQLVKRLVLDIGGKDDEVDWLVMELVPVAVMNNLERI